MVSHLPLMCIWIPRITNIAKKEGWEKRRKDRERERREKEKGDKLTYCRHPQMEDMRDIEGKFVMVYSQPTFIL